MQIGLKIDEIGACACIAKFNFTNEILKISLAAETAVQRAGPYSFILVSKDLLHWQSSSVQEPYFTIISGVGT